MSKPHPLSGMQVIKRQGNRETVSFDKVTNRIRKLCNGLSIDPMIISQKVVAQIYDGVETVKLDELSAEICATMVTENPEYGILASRIAVSNMHKKTSPSFSEAMTELFNNVDVSGKSCPLIGQIEYDVIMKNRDKLNTAIDHNRDYAFSYFGIKTLENNGYLFKINGRLIERIQYMFMRVSIGLHRDNINDVLQTYNCMSTKRFTQATPTLFHAGTPHPQCSSCFLGGTDDSVEGMYKTLSNMAIISKWGGGLGIHISNIRGKGSRVRGTNGVSNGIVPLLKTYNEALKHIDQAGRRPGSAAIYLEMHHPDIIDFLDMKRNNGDEHSRARELFYALWVSDLFMKRVEEDKEWSLFDPDECPGLSDVYGDEYTELYLKYETAKKARKTIRARDLMNRACDSMIETGVPYISFKDHVNRKNNQKNYGIIRSSNLCNEINLYSDSKEYAVCNLASINLSSFVNNGIVDYNGLIEIAGIITNNLNRVIDINYYPIPETKLSNLRHRPIGIGVQGLQDMYFKLRFPYDSEGARNVNVRVFEAIYYGALKKSCELAKRDGPYETFWASPMAKGQFQFDLWNVEPLHKIVDGEKVFDYPWDELRTDIMKHGLRNSVLTSLMPTASTSQILGNVESFEPITSNIYTRQTSAGSFILVNEYLVKDLMELGLWNKSMKDIIVANNGSIQNITNIPANIRELYKTAWDLKQSEVIRQCADRGPYICQTQSMNLFFEEPTRDKLIKALFYGWNKGLKSGSYYIRSRPKIQAQQFTIDPKLKINPVVVVNNTQDNKDSPQQDKDSTIDDSPRNNSLQDSSTDDNPQDSGENTPTEMTEEEIAAAYEAAREVCSRTNRAACEMCSS